MDVIFQVLLDQSCSPGKFHHREVELSWQDRIHTKDTAHAFQLLACVVSSHTCDRKWSFLQLKFRTSSHHVRLLRKGGFHTSYLSDWIWKPEKCSLQAWNVGKSKDKPGCVGRHTFLLPPFGTQLWSNRELKLLQSLKLLSQNSWGSPDQPRRWHFPCSEKEGVWLTAAGRWSRDTGGAVTWSEVYLL